MSVPVFPFSWRILERPSKLGFARIFVLVSCKEALGWGVDREGAGVMEVALRASELPSRNRLLLLLLPPFNHLEDDRRSSSNDGRSACKKLLDRRGDTEVVCDKVMAVVMGGGSGCVEGECGSNKESEGVALYCHDE